MWSGRQMPGTCSVVADVSKGAVRSVADIDVIGLSDYFCQFLNIVTHISNFHYIMNNTTVWC